MENKLETDLASSPRNDESDGDAEDPVDQEEEEEYEEPKVENKAPNNNVQNILKKLQSSGALIKKPKQEYRCVTCDEDYPSWEVLENHLIQHVSLPSVVLDKLPSDDEDTPPSGDENWSDEEEEAPPPKAAASTTPKKLDVSQLMKLNIKKPAETPKYNDAALSKLSGLGFTIKKNATPIKTEPEESSSDLMSKLGKLGGIKLKLKSDGNNTNSFKVVNGLKDFKASDEEDEDGEGSGNEESRDDPEGEDDEEQDKSGEQEDSGGEQDSADEGTGNKSRKNSESDDANKINKKIANALKNLQGKSVQVKSEPLKVPKTEPVQSPAKLVKTAQEVKLPAKPGRPAVKQTPKRGANLPLQKETHVAQATPTPPPTPPSVPERRESRDVNINNVVVKQEVDSEENRATANTTPLFSTQIKSERTSPPLTTSTPTITSVKTEPESLPVPNAQPLFSNQNTAPLLPVTKKETEDMTIIEINGDSGDDDDDCCVVSATPAPDIKPIIPKTETLAPVYPPPAYPTSAASTPHAPSSYNSTPSMLSSRLSSAPSTEKQHTFNWNAPDSKPHLDMLEKSTDEIFESLLSSATKKERDLALSDASEYISIDTLGPQHTCDVCNTRFTEMSLLEEHKRMTGHSMSLIAPSASSSLLPYSQSSNILSSLLPVKQLAEQVGKLSGMGSGPGFTHQQNVMINIQAYPGAGGAMGPPQPYNSYPGASAYPQTPNNMYGGTGQPMTGQYPGQHYMGQQGYGQYQPPMSKAGFPDTSYASATPYSTASPLQNMQQAYGASPASMMNTQAAMGQMGPPGSVPISPVGNQYVPASSPGGSMKPPASSNVRIQNVQTFAPGQLVGAAGSEMAAPGQIVGGQMPSPSQIRMAPGATVTGTRPRMPNTIRGARPSIRPGIQVHGQVRGAKPGGPRMPMKRPGGMINAQSQKQRRPDMLLPGKHDNEDCQVMAMQKQREGLPMIHSVQGAKDKLNLGSQISITKKTVNREANDMARALASRGISVKQKQKSRSPSPERPVPRIPNLGAGVSIKHANKSSNFSIPEAKVGGGMLSCKLCKKMFMNHNSLQVHMSNAHPQSKIPMFKCDECPASYPKSLQLQHHKRVFHNVSGPNRELGLPVVDLSQEDNLKRLSNLGIYSFIPLANREQASGCFGIPVVSVHNGMSTNLQALGADGLLSLGPLKPLPNS